MQITTNQILKLLYILSWIIFIGLCVEAGGILFNTVYTLVNPAGAKYAWDPLELSGLYAFDQGYFIQLASIAAIIAVMKAWMFYLIVKVLHDKKLTIEQPFNKDVVNFIFTVSYCTFVIGFFSMYGERHSRWLVKKGALLPDTHSLKFDSSDVWVFMGITLIVIGHIFKKGIEIQTENELTV